MKKIFLLLTMAIIFTKTTFALTETASITTKALEDFAAVESAVKSEGAINFIKNIASSTTSNVWSGIKFTGNFALNTGCYTLKTISNTFIGAGLVGMFAFPDELLSKEALKNSLTEISSSKLQIAFLLLNIIGALRSENKIFNLISGISGQLLTAIATNLGIEHLKQINKILTKKDPSEDAKLADLEKNAILKSFFFFLIVASAVLGTDYVLSLLASYTGISKTILGVELGSIFDFTTTKLAPFLSPIVNMLTPVATTVGNFTKYVVMEIPASILESIYSMLNSSALMPI